jgi:hypothetical protein
LIDVDDDFVAAPGPAIDELAVHLLCQLPPDVLPARAKQRSQKSGRRGVWGGDLVIRISHIGLSSSTDEREIPGGKKKRPQQNAKKNSRSGVCWSSSGRVSLGGFRLVPRGGRPESNPVSARSSNPRPPCFLCVFCVFCGHSPRFYRAEAVEVPMTVDMGVAGVDAIWICR